MINLQEKDLDDFITPGPVCIKPVEVVRTSKDGEVRIETGGFEIILGAKLARQLVRD